ncbi:MAG: hypothetical protein FD180_2227 [Planctomycetota bacterium]|nr:MAG: hypothetical protein FD180_2227 [Planctomycetota bacterium]
MKRLRVLALGVLLAACSKKPVPAATGSPAVKYTPIEKNVLWVSEIPSHYKSANGYGLWSQIYSGLGSNGVGSDKDPAKSYDATLTVACSERICGKFDNGDDGWTFTLRFAVTPKGASAPTLDFTVEAGSLKMEYVSKKMPVRVVAMDHLMNDERTKLAPALIAAALGVKVAVPDVLKGCLKAATRETAVAALKAGGWAPASEAEKAAWAIGTGDKAAIAATGDAAVDAAMSVLSGSFPRSDDVALLAPVLAEVRTPRAGEAQAKVLTAMVDGKTLALAPGSLLLLVRALEHDGAADALPALEKITAGKASTFYDELKTQEVRDAATKTASAIRARTGGK